MGGDLRVGHESALVLHRKGEQMEFALRKVNRPMRRVTQSMRPYLSAQSSPNARPKTDDVRRQLVDVAKVRPLDLSQ
jgi:hypothetical protein